MKYFFIVYCICLSFSYISVTYAQQKPAVGKYEIENNEPVYYQSVLNRMTYPLSWENAGQINFDSWKTKAREKIWDALGDLPLETDFNYQIIAEQQREGYKALKIELNISLDARIETYLLIPDGVGPFPALVALHDHGGEFSIGKEKMIAPFDVEQKKAEKAQQWVDKCYDGIFIGDEYARNGYVVLSIDALYWGDRGRKEGSTGDAQQALAANLIQMGMTWTGCILADDFRSVRFLASLTEVDAARIGVVGFSMGGFRAWLLGAMCEEVAASASVCWMTTTEKAMQPGSHILKGTSAYSMMLPGIKRYMDYPHIASLTAPRPLLLFNGLQDKLFFPEGTTDAYRIMRPVWESQQAGEKLVTQWWDLPHIFNMPMQEQVLDFFNKHLENQ